VFEKPPQQKVKKEIKTNKPITEKKIISDTKKK
jgi:hypothetical protein